MKKRPQVEIPTKHYYSPGIYAREITVPAGVILMGMLHKCPQMNILSKGTIRVLVDNEIKELTAPFTVMSPAGTKRIAFTVTEVVWTTVLHTFKTDPEDIEKEFIAHSEAEYRDFIKSAEAQQCLS